VKQPILLIFATVVALFGYKGKQGKDSSTAKSWQLNALQKITIDGLLLFDRGNQTECKKQPVLQFCPAGKVLYTAKANSHRGKQPNGSCGFVKIQKTTRQYPATIYDGLLKPIIPHPGR
jgi:hypothetical protein